MNNKQKYKTSNNFSDGILGILYCKLDDELMMI